MLCEFDIPLSLGVRMARERWVAQDEVSGKWLVGIT